MSSLQAWNDNVLNVVRGGERSVQVKWHRPARRGRAPGGTAGGRPGPVPRARAAAAPRPALAPALQLAACSSRAAALQPSTWVKSLGSALEAARLVPRTEGNLAAERLLIAAPDAQHSFTAQRAAALVEAFSRDQKHRRDRHDAVVRLVAARCRNGVANVAIGAGNIAHEKPSVSPWHWPERLRSQFCSGHGLMAVAAVSSCLICRQRMRRRLSSPSSLLKRCCTACTITRWLRLEVCFA